MHCKKTKIFIGGISKKLTQCNFILFYPLSRPSKDLNENEHPFYGPRINKIIKNNFGSSFSPY